MKYSTEHGDIVEFNGRKYIALHGTDLNSCVGCCFKDDDEKCIQVSCITDKSEPLIYAIMLSDEELVEAAMKGVNNGDK